MGDGLFFRRAFDLVRLCALTKCNISCTLVPLLFSTPKSKKTKLKEPSSNENILARHTRVVRLRYCMFKC